MLQNNQYYKTLKEFQRKRFGVASLVEEPIKESERRMISAFVRFCGYHEFNKQFCDEVRVKIYQRLSGDLLSPFYNLMLLIDEQHNEKEFSFLYFLYCYWAVDLLNQIPE